MLKYGNDKPDLRNPIEIVDVTNIFADSSFAVFEDNIQNGSVVRAIPGPKVATKSRKYFDDLTKFAIFYNEILCNKNFSEVY
jgi:aspartyl-tRNA synthetase